MSDYEEAIALAETVLATTRGSTPPQKLALAVLDMARGREHLRIKDEQIAGLRAKVGSLGVGIARANEAIGRRNTHIERLKARNAQLSAINDALLLKQGEEDIKAERLHDHDNVRKELG